jgi:hypothetical protein
MNTLGLVAVAPSPPLAHSPEFSRNPSRSADWEAEGSARAAMPLGSWMMLGTFHGLASQR